MKKCWHYRRIISRSADENTPLPPATQAHLAHCPDCRHLHETEHEIASQLTAGATAQKLGHPPKFIPTRVLAHIAASSSESRPVTGLSFLRLPVALAAIVIVLTAILLWPNRPRSEAPAVKEPIATLDLPDGKVLTQWATNPDKPLETEVNAVIHDARGALTALVENFFPEKLRLSFLNPTSARN